MMFTAGDCKIMVSELSEGKLAEARQKVREMLQALAPHCEIEKGPDGAPYLTRDGARQPLHISISHSRRYAALAIAQHPIGIDVEEQRAALLRVKTRFLSAAEQLWLPDSALLQAWTIKEAVYKAAGIRRLTGPEIEIDPSLQTAAAAGHIYRLDYWRLGDSLLTLAH